MPGTKACISAVIGVGSVIVAGVVPLGHEACVGLLVVVPKGVIGVTVATDAPEPPTTMIIGSKKRLRTIDEKT